MIQDGKGDTAQINVLNTLDQETKVYENFKDYNINEDVVVEKETALRYLLLSPIDYLNYEQFAIIIQNLKHIFPNGTVAVKELSLALRYEECFGFLIEQVNQPLFQCYLEH